MGTQEIVAPVFEFDLRSILLAFPSKSYLSALPEALTYGTIE